MFKIYCLISNSLKPTSITDHFSLILFTKVDYPITFNDNTITEFNFRSINDLIKIEDWHSNFVDEYRLQA